MASMGVRRLDARPAKGPKAGGTPPKAGATPSKAGATPSKAGATPSKAGATPSKAGVAPAATKALEAELAAARAELAAARALAAATQADQARLQDQLSLELAGRQAALDAARAEIQRLQRALARADGDPAGDPPSALDRLAAADVRGPTEADALLRAVADGRLSTDLLRQLAVPDPAALDAFLEDRLLLLGGCDACPTDSGRVVLRVPHARCQACRGGDLRASQRRFLDACLVNGLTRVVLVGGRAKDHRLLRGLVEDRRLVLTLVPGQQGRAAERVAEDLAAARAVALWQGPALDPAVAEPYRAYPGPLVTVEADGPGPLLDALARALPRALD